MHTSTPRPTVRRILVAGALVVGLAGAGMATPASAIPPGPDDLVAQCALLPEGCPPAPDPDPDPEPPFDGPGDLTIDPCDVQPDLCPPDVPDPTGESDDGTDAGTTDPGAPGADVDPAIPGRPTFTG